MLTWLYHVPVRDINHVRTGIFFCKSNQSFGWRQQRPHSIIIVLMIYTCITKVKLNMMMSSNGNIFRVTDPLCGEYTGHRWIPPHKRQWCEALMSSLICAWINGWVNEDEAGDLRRYHAHHDVIVMTLEMSRDFAKFLLSLWQWSRI